MCISKKFSRLVGAAARVQQAQRQACSLARHCITWFGILEAVVVKACSHHQVDSELQHPIKSSTHPHCPCTARSSHPGTPPRSQVPNANHRSIVISGPIYRKEPTCVVHVQHVFDILERLLVAGAQPRHAQAQARAVLDDLQSWTARQGEQSRQVLQTGHAADKAGAGVAKAVQQARCLMTCRQNGESTTKWRTAMAAKHPNQTKTAARRFLSAPRAAWCAASAAGTGALLANPTRKVCEKQSRHTQNAPRAAWRAGSRA